MQRTQSHMTDADWCAHLEDRYGELEAIRIYQLFPDKDGTAPLKFQDKTQPSLDSTPSYTRESIYQGGHDAPRLAA